jgi:hypothetical protein
LRPLGRGATDRIGRRHSLEHGRYDIDGKALEDVRHPIVYGQQRSELGTQWRVIGARVDEGSAGVTGEFDGLLEQHREAIVLFVAHDVS